METSIILAIAAIVLTAGVGAASALLRLGSDFKAQRDLARLMTKPGHSSSLQRLQQERAALAKASPDHAKLEEAAEVVQSLASELPKRKERAVLAHLREGPETNVASYVVRLIDEAAEHRTSAPETGAST